MCVAWQYMHLERKLRHMGPNSGYLQGHICFCTTSSGPCFVPQTFPFALPVSLSSTGDLMALLFQPLCWLLVLSLRQCRLSTNAMSVW